MRLRDPKSKNGLPNWASARQGLAQRFPAFIAAETGNGRKVVNFAGSKANQDRAIAINPVGALAPELRAGAKSMAVR